MSRAETFFAEAFAEGTDADRGIAVFRLAIDCGRQLERAAIRGRVDTSRNRRISM